jgi:TMEM175 potassium channel family protein
MNKTRLEAFSDGVIAILITIMVLELRPPIGLDPFALGKFKHALAAYILSFVMLAIYWNNHHHMLHTCTHVNGRILWANSYLLFWLSLVPFVTAWISDELTSWSAAAYGFVAFMAGIAWLLLRRAIVADQGPDSPLQAAVGKDWKGRLSGLMSFISIPLAFVHPYITMTLMAVMWLVWVIPDRRIESRIGR